ncbi:hypothetical protein C8R45DRAFT_929392 [Mycena sanguinolenta]|nr:hypothetical protein C8R45DRAFT_929392 [Mycena sanguinolenta]
MAKGQFNKLQSNHIESFFPEFVKEMDKGTTGAALTHWNQAKASSILESASFEGLDFEKFSHKAWFEMIVRKFTNYRNQVYLKEEGNQPNLPPSAQKNNPLLKYSIMMTGRELFARDNHQSLSTAVKQRSLDTCNNNSAAVYQTILKERWDSLSGEGQSGKILGDSEMLLFYGYCEASTGDLCTGTIHGHSIHNTVNFGGSREELELRYGIPWSEFAEKAIPRPIISSLLIPRNSNNEPVFPSIDINNVLIPDMRMLLSDYFDQCWGIFSAHQHPDGSVVPWEDIALNPTKYYDTVASNFPSAMDHPQNLEDDRKSVPETPDVLPPTPPVQLPPVTPHRRPPTPVSTTIPASTPEAENLSELSPQKSPKKSRMKEPPQANPTRRQSGRSKKSAAPKVVQKPKHKKSGIWICSTKINLVPSVKTPSHRYAFRFARLKHTCKTSIHGLAPTRLQAHSMDSHMQDFNRKAWTCKALRRMMMIEEKRLRAAEWDAPAFELEAARLEARRGTFFKCEHNEDTKQQRLQSQAETRGAEANGATKYQPAGFHADIRVRAAS